MVTGDGGRLTRRREAERDSRGTRAGYVALIGRPNAGKSTLLNAFVGQKLSIVTPRAQTTWSRVTGIVSSDRAQMVFVDTPGLLRVKDMLQRSMLGAAHAALADADVALLVVDTTRPPRELEAPHVREALDAARVPLLAALNKVDAAGGDEVDAAEASTRAVGATPYRISALTGEGVPELRRAVEAALPQSPFFFPEEDVAEQPVRFFVAELVRETVFEQFRQEIPWSVAARVEAFRETEDPIYIAVVLWVERESQKGILVGSGGHAIRRLGKAARAKIETFLGAPVYLDLWVKTLPGWRRKPAQLARLGYPVPEDPA